MDSRELLNLLKKTGALMEGHFLLTSGRHSNIYIEKFRILEDPVALDAVCKSMAQIVENKGVELVLGAAVGGILLAGGVGRHLGVKHIFSERVNGNMELRRGFTISPGEKVVIVEDIITTGGSVFELIELANSRNAEIISVVNLVDRSSCGVDFGVPSQALLQLPSESWEQENCPLCENNIPITQRGRTGKQLETV
ncbi:MAG: orotate phosphoribosyltransferase [Candidatus Marinimicrobia bacterium]|jgi:orotate phosphoribosyltransferase|nr:orotate phosphoribosyltransferase [Candidatus Neomarinimicrobiota bacterium]MDP6936854.1 orotate phosphoribosyltransferase [Candidatus Neomarinimicrobiota bacterium]